MIYICNKIWKIGNFIFNIKTKKEKISYPFYIFPRGIGNLTQINIVLNEDFEEKRKVIEFCEKEAELFVPEEIEYFYKSINALLKGRYLISEHVNRYYKVQDEIFGYFPYLTDNFVLQYSYKNDKIILYGNENNLYRVILDFLTVSGEYLPLHASAVAKGNVSLGFIAESGSGKTSLSIKLLERGYSLITDDSLFADNDGIFPVSKIIRINKEYPICSEFKKVIKQSDYKKISLNLDCIEKKFVLPNQTKKRRFLDMKFFILQKGEKKWKGLEYMKEPFPAISQHSFWCMQFIVKEKKEEWINEKIKKSIDLWNEKIKDAKIIKMDFDSFNNNVKQIKKLLAR